MPRRHAWLTCSLAAFLVAGCGTAHNLAPEIVPFPYSGTRDRCQDATQVYGGVKRDWYALTGWWWDEEYAPANRSLTPFYLADLPLSAVADTLTLPYAVWEEIGMRDKAGCSIHAAERWSRRPETMFRPSRLTARLTGERVERGRPTARELAAQEDAEGASRRANTVPAPPQSESSPGLGGRLSPQVKPPAESDLPWTPSRRIDMPIAKSP